MDFSRVTFDVFMVSAIAMIFVVAISIFTNMSGYMMIGGEIKKQSDNDYNREPDNSAISNHPCKAFPDK